jgi:(p)ppGpp synthase/HD superfamily hydrolase
MWSLKEQEAIEFSFEAHRGQKRKGSGVDYISHPMAVGNILSKLKVDRDLIIAGFLHDIIEDTEWKKKELEEKFGKRVADLVEEVSEEDKSLSYQKRKDQAAKKILSISEEALLIKIADVISNTSDLILRLEEDGEKAFQIFNTDKNNKIADIERVVKILIQRSDNQALTEKLEENLNEILKYGN